tara:strand:- start:4935 stop:5075 length:141 start_codon:yes stop_codon:yes gene_type:complete
MNDKLEKKLQKEVEQYYRNKKRTKESKLQQEASSFIKRKTKDGQEK